MEVPLDSLDLRVKGALTSDTEGERVRGGASGGRARWMLCGQDAVPVAVPQRSGADRCRGGSPTGHTHSCWAPCRRRLCPQVAVFCVTCFTVSHSRSVGGNVCPLGVELLVLRCPVLRVGLGPLTEVLAPQHWGLGTGAVYSHRLKTFIWGKELVAIWPFWEISLK